ncbi:MAG: addiction module toxin RelE [Nitrospirae bacterium]|nr:MAG: addiction module toxin RelE [Nitrospirota bacterium]
MARPLRIEIPGAVYHVTSRGNARETIFPDENDCSDFLDTLCSIVKRYSWILHAYCLMGNHYHLLVETTEGNLSKGMRQLNGVYTQRFNRRHQRVGHILQGRYKAILVDKDSYLLELCRYVVLNPVRAGLAKSPGDWGWSSYNATIGKNIKVSCLTTDWILLQFGEKRENAVQRYREFVRSGMSEESPLKAVRGQLILGHDEFVDRFENLLLGKQDIKEVPKEQRHATRPPLKELLKGIGKKADDDKDRQIYDAHVKYGYTLREIAEGFKVHYSTISRAVKRVTEREKGVSARCKT